MLTYCIVSQLFLLVTLGLESDLHTDATERREDALLHFVPAVFQRSNRSYVHYYTLKYHQNSPVREGLGPFFIDELTWTHKGVLVHLGC